MSATLWVTEDCQMNCSYCYEGKKVKVYMNEETALSACRFALREYEMKKENRRFLLQIHGGEPLLNQRILFKACEYISDYFHGDRKKYGIRMTTNALLVTEQNLHLLKKYMEQISVSIDGDKKTHDRNRRLKNGEGSFFLVYSQALKLLKAMPDTMARMTIAANSASELYENVKFLYESGFQWISAVINETDNSWNDDTYKVLEKQVEECCDYVFRQRENGRIIHLGLLEEDVLYRKNSPCTAGRGDLHISAEGKLYACNSTVGIEEFCVGNIYSGWNEEKLQVLTRHNLERVEECEGCARYDFCPAVKCKILNKIRTGDYNRACIGTCYQQNLRIHAYNYYLKCRDKEHLT